MYQGNIAEYVEALSIYLENYFDSYISLEKSYAYPDRFLLSINRGAERGLQFYLYTLDDEDIEEQILEKVKTTLHI